MKNRLGWIAIPLDECENEYIWDALEGVFFPSGDKYTVSGMCFIHGSSDWFDVTSPNEVAPTYDLILDEYNEFHGFQATVD